MMAFQSDGKLFNLQMTLQDKSNVQTDVLDKLLYADNMAKNASKGRKMQEIMDRVSQTCDNYDIKHNKKSSQWMDKDS